MRRIEIKPNNQRNSLTLISAGALILISSAILLSWQLPQAWIIAPSLLALVCLVLGWVKRLEPKISISITPRGICYYHRKGKWQIPWQQVQRIDVVSSGDATLPFVGIRLRQPLHHVQRIKPRLALALTVEQRVLQRLVEPQSCSQCELLLDSDRSSPFVGVRAAYFRHQQLLRQQLGFDLYLPDSAIDRSCSEMVQLLKRCRDETLKPSFQL